MAREGSEYERQYEEDMERAQALSLESLALEQFKNKRLQELNDISKTKSVSVCRASSMSESDSNKPKYDRQLSKSRPRPGTSSGRSNSLIAPPPQSMRKNSSAQDSPDLISFVNPTTTASSDIVQFCQNYNTAYSQMTVFQPNVYTAPVQQQQVWFKQMPANGGYQSPVQTPGTVYRPPCTFPQIPQINSQLNQAPALPPKNQHRTPPALVLPSSKSSLRQQQKPSNLLIDLVAHPDDRNSVRVSILQEFDPILSESEESMRNLSPDSSMDDSESVYDEYDPYDIYTGSGNNSLSDPLYAAVVRSETAPQSPPPAPPPRSHRMGVATEGVAKVDLVSSVKRVEGHNCNKRDSDLRAFYQMVYDVRKKFRHNDPDTNMGLVISPLVDYQYKDETSIKLCVYPDFEGADVTKPITFTCDVTCSVEHVTLQLICDLEAPVKDKYTLKVWGCCEYLVPTTLLSDYEYVHNCIKLEEDVVLTLIPDSKVDRSFARTLQDDVRDKELTFEDVVSCDSATYISYEQLSILVETVESEIKKLEEAAVQMENFNNPSTIPGMQPQAVVQTVKYVINMMGGLCPLDIMEAVEHLQQICKNFLPYRDNSTITEAVRSTCNRIRLGIQNLIEIYSRAFKVDFEVTGKTATSEATKYVPDLQDSLLVRICAIYRPNVEWKHDSYIVAAQIYHGMRPIGHPVLSPPSVKTEDGSWPARINFDYWFQMVDVPICSLARESRLVLVVYGRTLEAPEGDSSNAPQYKQEEIGWAAVQFFDYEGVMIQGNRVLSIWPREAQFVQGPAPPAGTHPHSDHPMLDIQITGLFRVEFPSLPPDLTIGSQSAPFDSLDSQTQRQLTEICEQDMLHKLAPEVREVLWEKRHYLHHKPEALPKILLAAKSWEYACLPDLHGMAHAWTPPKPVEALQFLLPTFPDVEVRKLAVRWIGGLSNDELIDYIPQLVVALRHETYENSALAQFLLERALRSPRFAHHLFWLLSHTLPGSLPQNLPCENVTERDEVEVSEVRHHRRMKLMLRALLAVCGEALRSCFLSQQILVKELNDIASTVQKTKESHRITVLHNGLNGVHSNLSDNPTSLPLSPTLKVAGVQVHSSFYFPSNTLPLKISFLAPDESVIPAIYKVGDDLQQDMLTLQMVRLMDKLWLNKGLDLKMVSFVCVPTGKKKGMIEMVTNAETLRKIQVEHGLTGSFKDKPIAEWLAKHNPSELEYGRAVENFTASCAGYCVVTYILGICDRHNDNIMLKTSGHLFHIDFGKFLGDAQMFGNFKRDRAPFVLTSDMAYVINGGDRPSEKFHKFVDLCCQAFNIIRANCNLFLYLFTLMASSGICGVTPESVSYLHKALLPTMSNPEAAAYFARLIESSLKSWFTQFNFFLHNLAQLKFSSEHSEGALLSFVPKVYSVATDGRLVHVLVVSYKKRYDPDKYYVYVLRVYRESSKGHMEIQRTYKEFCELHQKLCIYFPLAKLHSLSTGLHVGRSNIKQVAQKRYREVSLFVTSLFKCADEIAHSDLVYTFFHPLLRDQQFEEYSKNRKSELKDEAGRLKGQLKLSFQFCKGSFNVMVYHARSLPLSSNGQEPSTYVKVYLLPDQNKSTKRKTKVVRRNCHPSFVEMLEYRMALEIIRERHLQATVWNYDPLQENEFLGGVDLELCNFDLTKETAEWYPLVNLSR